jgi:D-arabinose 1-dehydrogenase-like Zn-dependent alcohol dehydrogenase
VATTSEAVGLMQVARISRPGGKFEIVERKTPEKEARQVRIKSQACGVCHSDVFVKGGLWPRHSVSSRSGHEVAGIIDELGACTNRTASSYRTVRVIEPARSSLVQMRLRYFGQLTGS